MCSSDLPLNWHASCGVRPRNGTSDVWFLPPDPAVNGPGNGVRLKRSLQVCDALGVPLAPGPHETLFNLQLRAIPSQQRAPLFAAITADPACNPDVLRRLPVKRGPLGYLLSTDEREDVYAKRGLHLQAYLPQVPALGAAAGSGTRGACAFLTTEIGRAHV